MSKSKLLIIETTYQLETNLPCLDTVVRRPINSIATVIEDEVGTHGELPNGTRVTLTDTGALVNNRFPIQISPQRRTGGRLITEKRAINIRPINNDSKVDEMLSMGFPINHVPSDSNPI